jgi:4-amino-4-deoxy-L-arabinose transferase-like glycosyltransferase
VTRRTTYLLLFLIIIGGAILRFYQISEKGLFFWDEGLFLMGARFVRWRLVELAENISRFGWRLTSLHSDVANFVGYPVFLQKPGQVIGLTILSFFIGTGDYLGQAASALLGTASLVVIFLIGRQVGGSKLGLLSAFFLAVCPTHLHYSRLGLHEVPSLFFVMTAVWLHFLSLRVFQRRGIDEILFFSQGPLLDWE